MTVVVREISREPGRSSELVGSALVLRLLIGVAVVALAGMLSLVLPYSPDVRVAILLGHPAKGNSFGGHNRKTFSQIVTRLIAENRNRAGAGTIVAMFAAPRFFDDRVFLTRGYYEELAAALKYAQKLAVASGCPVRVAVAAAGYDARQQAAQAGSCTPADATWATPVALADGQLLAGTAPLGVAAAPAVTVTFDALGRTDLAADQAIAVGPVQIVEEDDQGPSAGDLDQERRELAHEERPGGGRDVGRRQLAERGGSGERDHTLRGLEHRRRRPEGLADRVEELSVQWSSGKKTSLSGLETNRIVTVREGL